MVQIEEYARRLRELKQRMHEVFLALQYPYKEPKDNEKIHLVFVGQYSAGKSSILSMLTGNRDIKIGEGITTQQIAKYDWNGIEVIDTPGIHTELRPDHDAISYEAIASADLLVYVVSNELFDAHLGEKFRTVAIDKDKAGEMILVVNKMCRTSKGNVPDQQEVIKHADGLADVIAPYKPENLNISFLDAESYLDSLDEEDPELALELKKRSGYDAFIATLNKFIKEKEISSKLTTSLYQMDAEIARAMERVESNQNDADIKALEENYRQQRFLFVQSRDGIRQEVSAIFTNVSSQIKELGIEAANLIDSDCKPQEVELALAEKVQAAQSLLENVEDMVTSSIKSRLEDLRLEIETLEGSEFSRALKVRLEGRMNSLPDNVKKVLEYGPTALNKASNAIIKNAYRSGMSGGLKLSNFSGGNVHAIVLKVGKFAGYKFKPWEAIKLTKGIAVAAHVMAILGVVLSVGMQITEDIQAEKLRKTLEQNRINIRSQFNDAASGLEDFGRNYIKEVIDKNIDPSIREMDEKLRHLKMDAILNNENHKKLLQLQDDCIALIQEIHQ